MLVAPLCLSAGEPFAPQRQFRCLRCFPLAQRSARDWTVPVSASCGEARGRLLLGSAVGHALVSASRANSWRISQRSVEREPPVSRFDCDMDKASDCSLPLFFYTRSRLVSGRPYLSPIRRHK